MRNFLRNTVAALGVFLMSIAALSPALALTNPATFAPRMFPNQQTHYLRFVVNFNSCVIAAAATTCSLKVGALPYNAFLTAIHKQIITTFNPTTSATVSLNVTGAGAGVMAAFNVFTGQATTAALDTSFTGAGELVTGAGATATGADGGFDLYMLYTVGAAGSQGTQGQVVFILEYIAPNDGACLQNVPFGGTSAAC
jgi:hypothetical protein